MCRMAVFCLLGLLLIVSPLNGERSTGESSIEQQIAEINPRIHVSPDSCQDVLQAILRESRANDFVRGQFLAYLNLWNVYHVKGKYDSVRYSLDRALDLSNGIANSEEMARLYIGRGVNQTDLHAYESALESLDLANQYAGNAKDSVALKAEIYNNRANIYSRQGKYELAIANYLEAAGMYNEKDHPRKLAIVYNNIGTENDNWGRNNKAIEYYKRAAALNKASDDLFNLSMNYANIGVSYKEMDSTETALEFYRKSIAIAKKLDSPVRLAQNYLNMANIYKEQHQFAMADEYFTKCLELCRQSDIYYGILLSHVNMGHNEFLQDNYSAASVHYDSALALAKRLSLPQEEFQVHWNMYELLAAQKKYPRAIEHLTAYHVLKDSIHNQQVQGQVEELQIRYETAKTEKENALLRKEKEAQAALLKKNQTIMVLIGLSLIGAVVSLILVNRSRSRKAEAYELLEEKNIELEATIEKVKLLQGLLPMCASCKKIRDDEGYWQEVESYISDHSDAIFTHGICPQCMAELYPKHVKDKDKEN